MAKNIKKTVEKKIVEENKYFNYLLVAAFAVFLCLFTTFKITGDDDVFWHLATGKYVLDTKSVPSTDVFGYMTYGQEWMPFEWGWDILTYGIYNIGGFEAISILRTILLFAVFWIYFYIFRKFKVSYTVIFFSLFALSFAIIDRLTPRPHLMTYLFFALLLLIIIQYRYFNRNNYKILYFIPGIFLIWANMHMGIIAGAFLLGIFVLSEIITYFKPLSLGTKEVRPLEKNELIRLIIIFGVSLLVMLINPNGFATYVYAYEHTKMKMLQTVNEWFSPFSERYGKGMATTFYKVLLFLGLLVLVDAFRKKDIFRALLYIGFALYSVRAMRFTVDYVLILFIFIVLAINSFIVSLKSQSVKDFIEKKPLLKIGLILLFIYTYSPILNNSIYLNFLQYYRITGFGINSDFIPVQLFDFMKANNVQNIGERVFNHFGTGGFFIWNFPDKKNFIDSRNLNDDIFFKYNDLISKRPGFEKKLDEYGIDYAIYLAPDLVRMPEEMQSTIISYFCTSPNWKLIFWDDKSFLWVRNLPKFEELIQKYEYKYLNPYSYSYYRQQIEKGLREDKQTVKKEYDRKMSETPDGIVINSIKQIFGNKINN